MRFKGPVRCPSPLCNIYLERTKIDENNDYLEEDDEVNVSTDKNEMKKLTEYNGGIIEKRDRELEIRKDRNSDDSNLETD